MDEKRKAISADDRLRALALFVMAKEHAIKAREFELPLLALLDVEDGGHISDEIWGFGAERMPRSDIFDDILERLGIAVVPEGE